MLATKAYDYWDFILRFWRIRPGMSENRAVPANTRKVPNQWVNVNGFWKYQMLRSRDKNFLKVTTNVTVREEHVAERLQTVFMQTHLEENTSLKFQTYDLKSATVLTEW